jgi:hypothetical protein
MPKSLVNAAAERKPPGRKRQGLHASSKDEVSRQIQLSSPGLTG